MRFPCFVYKAGGSLTYKGKQYSYLSVNSDDDVKAALADGWAMTRDEALFPAPKAEPNEDAPPTRAELEQRAAELGIKVDGRWSDKRLATEIEKVS